MEWLKKNLFSIIALVVAAIGVWFTAQIAPFDKRLALIEQNNSLVSTKITALELQSRSYVTREELKISVDERMGRVEDKLNDIEKYLRESER